MQVVPEHFVTLIGISRYLFTGNPGHSIIWSDDGMPSPFLNYKGKYGCHSNPLIHESL